MDKLIFEYSTDKNLKLINERGIGFEDVVAILDAEGCIGVIDHPNFKKYPNQQIYLIAIENYIYQVLSEKYNNIVKLKTIFPSRKMTHLYQDSLNRGN